MTITFENDNDIIVYALEKVISYARRKQHLFLAQCVWWLASVIGLEQGLVTHIDNLYTREIQTTKEISPEPKDLSEDRDISPDPRDLQEDRRLDQKLTDINEYLNNSARIRNTLQQGKVNPLPQTKNQLKKARKAKRLQEAKLIYPLQQSKNQRRKARRAKLLREANLSRE